MRCDAGSTLLYSVSNTVLTSKPCGDTRHHSPGTCKGRPGRARTPKRGTEQSDHDGHWFCVFVSRQHRPQSLTHTTPTALHVTSSLIYRKEMHLLRSPGGLAPDPLCPSSPFLAAKFKSESGGWISSGAQVVESCHFWGGGWVWRPRQEGLPEGGAGPGLRGGTWGFRKKEAEAQRWNGAEPHHWCGAVRGAERTRICQKRPFLERLRGWGKLDWASGFAGRVTIPQEDQIEQCQDQRWSWSASGWLLGQKGSELWGRV